MIDDSIEIEIKAAFDKHDSDGESSYYDFKAGYWAGRASKVPQWIPVSERLPEEREDVLVTDGESMAVTYYSLRQSMADRVLHPWTTPWSVEWSGLSEDEFSLSFTPTHWMPLPAPPTQEPS